MELILERLEHYGLDFVIPLTSEMQTVNSVQISDTVLIIKDYSPFDLDHGASKTNIALSLLHDGSLKNQVWLLESVMNFKEINGQTGPRFHEPYNHFSYMNHKYKPYSVRFDNNRPESILSNINNIYAHIDFS